MAKIIFVMNRLLFTLVIFLALSGCWGNKRKVVERVPVFATEQQREIDETRRQLYDSTKWGRGEIKPWQERYLDSEPGRPYQGSANPRRLLLKQ